MTDWLVQKQPRGLFNYLFNIKRNYQRSQRAGAKCKTRNQIKIRRGWEENKQLHLALVLLDMPSLILRRGLSECRSKTVKDGFKLSTFSEFQTTNTMDMDRSPLIVACIIHGISCLTAFLQTGLFLATN